jgi:hypothetical protein
MDCNDFLLPLEKVLRVRMYTMYIVCDLDFAEETFSLDCFLESLKLVFSGKMMNR